MRVMDVIRCAWRELRRRKWRTAATVFGYLLAVGVTVLLVSALRISRRSADAVLSSTGTHFIAYVPAGPPLCADCRTQQAAEPQEGFVAYGQATNLMSMSVVQRARVLPTVRDASGCLMFRFKESAGRGMLTVAGFDPLSDSAVRTTCCAATDIIGGRFLSAEETGAVMLEEAYAAMKGLKPKQKITIAGEVFAVAGVVNPGIRPAKADVYMHFADALALIRKHLGGSAIADEANVVLVEVSNAQVQDEAIRSVKALIPGIVVSSYACYRPAAKVMGINAGGAWALTLIVAVFAVVLALKSQLSSVIERRREIAILKAIGWTDGNVMRQILAESLLQAVLGGVLGCLFAVVVLLLVPGRLLAGAEAPSAVNLFPAVFLAGFLLALLGGVIAGTLPALSAARQNPADGMRRV